jgi:hypothetical protein
MRCRSGLAALWILIILLSAGVNAEAQEFGGIQKLLRSLYSAPLPGPSWVVSARNTSNQPVSVWFQVCNPFGGSCTSLSNAVLAPGEAFSAGHESLGFGDGIQYARIIYFGPSIQGTFQSFDPSEGRTLTLPVH